MNFDESCRFETDQRNFDCTFICGVSNNMRSKCTCKLSKSNFVNSTLDRLENLQSTLSSNYEKKTILQKCLDEKNTSNQDIIVCSVQKENPTSCDQECQLFVSVNGEYTKKDTTFKDEVFGDYISNTKTPDDDCEYKYAPEEVIQKAEKHNAPARLTNFNFPCGRLSAPSSNLPPNKLNQPVHDKLGFGTILGTSAIVGLIVVVIGAFLLSKRRKKQSYKFNENTNSADQI